MEIFYSNSVKSEMKDEKSLKRYYGKLANPIWLCLSVLTVAGCLKEVPNIPPTRRHKLTGMNNCWALDLNRNWRMIIRALDGTEIEEITKVEIVSVEDYH